MFSVFCQSFDVGSLGVYEGAFSFLFLYTILNSLSWASHFEARLARLVFVLSAIFCHFHFDKYIYFLHANKITTYDAYDKIKLEMYCLMILTRVAHF